MSNTTNPTTHSSDALWPSVWEALDTALCYATIYRKVKQGKDSAIAVVSAHTLEHHLSYENELKQLLSKLNELMPHLRVAYYANLRTRLKVTKPQSTTTKPHTDMTQGQAKQWLIENDREAADFWRDEANGDFVLAVGDNLRDFGNDANWHYAAPLANAVKEKDNEYEESCPHCGRIHEDLSDLQIAQMREGKGCLSDDCPGHEVKS